MRLPMPIGPCHPCPLPACPAPPVETAHLRPRPPPADRRPAAALGPEAAKRPAPRRFHPAFATLRRRRTHSSPIAKPRANSQEAAPTVTASRSLVRRAQWLLFRSFLLPARIPLVFNPRCVSESNRAWSDNPSPPKGDSTSELPIVLLQLLATSAGYFPNNSAPTRETDRPSQRGFLFSMTAAP